MKREKVICVAFLELLLRLPNNDPVIMEQEKEGSCPFLGTLLTRTKGGKINISAYRKTTHTDRYLQYSSHHPQYVKKKRMASCLFHCARTKAVGEKHRKKEHHLRMVLRSQGYPVHVIQNAAKPRRRKTISEEKTKYSIFLPYVAGIGEGLRRVCGKFDIRTVFTAANTLGQQLTKMKDTDPTLKD